MGGIGILNNKKLPEGMERVDTDEEFRDVFLRVGFNHNGLLIFEWDPDLIEHARNVLTPDNFFRFGNAVAATFQLVNEKVQGKKQ